MRPPPLYGSPPRRVDRRPRADSGDLVIGQAEIWTEGGEIWLRFPHPVQLVGLSVAEARALMDLLHAHAAEVEDWRRTMGEDARRVQPIHRFGKETRR